MKPSFSCPFSCIVSGQRSGLRLEGGNFATGVSAHRESSCRSTPGCARLAVARFAHPGLLPVARFGAEEHGLRCDCRPGVRSVLRSDALDGFVRCGDARGSESKFAVLCPQAEFAGIWNRR